MRGWGGLPICKASIPDHRLRIQATCNLAEVGKTGRRDGQKKTWEEGRERDKSLGSRKN
jgi:hypothetical protein